MHDLFDGLALARPEELPIDLVPGHPSVIVMGGVENGCLVGGDPGGEARTEHDRILRYEEVRIDGFKLPEGK